MTAWLHLLRLLPPPAGVPLLLCRRVCRRGGENTALVGGEVRTLRAQRNFRRTESRSCVGEFTKLYGYDLHVSEYLVAVTHCQLSCGEFTKLYGYDLHVSEYLVAVTHCQLSCNLVFVSCTAVRICKLL